MRFNGSRLLCLRIKEEARDEMALNQFISQTYYQWPFFFLENIYPSHTRFLISYGI